MQRVHSIIRVVRHGMPISHMRGGRKEGDEHALQPPIAATRSHPVRIATRHMSSPPHAECRKEQRTDTGKKRKKNRKVRLTACIANIIPDIVPPPKRRRACSAIRTTQRADRRLVRLFPTSTGSRSTAPSSSSSPSRGAAPHIHSRR